MRIDSTARHVCRHAGMMLFVLLAALLAPLSPAAAAAITGIAITDAAITLRFDEAVAGARAVLIGTPDRLAVDLDAVQPARVSAAGGAISATQVVPHGDHGARVLFDLDAPRTIRAVTLAPDGRSLLLTLRQASAQAFAAAVRAGTTIYSQFSADRSATTVVAAPVEAAHGLAMPPIAGRAGKPLVVIDAGHGGHDPGSLSLDGTRREKDAALAIARAVRDALLATGRVRVALTRGDDSFVALPERPEIARRLDADLFISIHADSAPGSTARGATIYTLSEVASDRVAARLAAKENRADILHGIDLGAQASDVSSILIDLTQRETMNASSRFADLLQRELTGQGVMFKTTYHRFAGLAVLKAPDVPAILLETGYMSDPQDLALLFSKSYQQELAEGVTRAVEAHFARRVGRVDLALRD